MKREDRKLIRQTQVKEQWKPGNWKLYHEWQHKQLEWIKAAIEVLKGRICYVDPYSSRHWRKRRRGHNWQRKRTKRLSE